MRPRMSQPVPSKGRPEEALLTDLRRMEIRQTTVNTNTPVYSERITRYHIRKRRDSGGRPRTTRTLASQTNALLTTLPSRVRVPT